MPFFRMLLAVVSLKCRRPTVTFVTCSGGRLTLQRRVGAAQAKGVQGMEGWGILGIDLGSLGTKVSPL